MDCTSIYVHCKCLLMILDGNSVSFTDMHNEDYVTFIVTTLSSKIKWFIRTQLQF